MRAALAPVHRRYAGLINARRKRTGHFWQGRYGAAVMDEDHLLAAFRYILRNPVTAKLAGSPAAWPWSSARAYLLGEDDGLTHTAAMRQRLGDVTDLLADAPPERPLPPIRAQESIGRPLDSPRATF